MSQKKLMLVVAFFLGCFVGAVLMYSFGNCRNNEMTLKVSAYQNGRLIN